MSWGFMDNEGAKDQRTAVVEEFRALDFWKLELTPVWSSLLQSTPVYSSFWVWRLEQTGVEWSWERGEMEWTAAGKGWISRDDRITDNRTTGLRDSARGWIPG